ncbi:hypothetical protein N7520_005044 [Penicillium odoratum]|uniref:uncharacterized protein n=1 Tax=Penicillium odoratum TaxID=1167516 RepID=UPI002547952C|nr:uncharacterized protein N7520_005044 [Penicillium odoratum]KAJ5765485.1 hypothetical protein N7520_005044 [Penicillium odoratum]
MKPSSFDHNVLIDQATDLPVQINIDIFSEMDRLVEPEDFNRWLRNRTRRLKSVGLGKLIDIHIPRPDMQSEAATRWLDYSKLVRHYLAENVSESLLAEIASQGSSIKLADEFVEQAKKKFQSPGVFADMDGVATLSSIKLSSHKTPQDFIWKFKEHFKRLWELKVQIPPYFAACKLVNQLDTKENSCIVTAAISELNRRADECDLWSEFNVVDFHLFCFKIIQRLDNQPKYQQGRNLNIPDRDAVTKMDLEIDGEELVAFKASLHRQAQKSAAVENEADDSPTTKLATNIGPERKHFPPDGVKPSVYAQNLRETLPSKASKECAYCGQKYHTAAKCFYLNPATRPKLWKPDYNIWCFMMGTNMETYQNEYLLKKSGESLTGAKQQGNTPLKALEKNKMGPKTDQITPIKKLDQDQPGSKPEKKTTSEKKTPVMKVDQGQTGSKPEQVPPVTPMTPVTPVTPVKRGQIQTGVKQEVVAPVKEPAKSVIGTKQKGSIPEKASSQSTTAKPVTKSEPQSAFIGSVFDSANNFTASKKDWLVVNGRGIHVCADLSSMVEYHAYGPDEIPFRWTWVRRGKRVAAEALGKGKAKISLLCEDRSKIMNIFIDCYYFPEAQFSLFLVPKAESDLFVKYNAANKTLEDVENGNKVIGYAVEEHGYSFLSTLNSTINVNLMD